MFVYTNELGETTQQVDVGRGVIVTRVGYSSAEQKQIHNEVFPKFYKAYYDAIVQQYIDAGYNPTKGGGGGPSGGQLLIKNLSQIPVIGSILSMFGGLFGGSQAAPEVPYNEVKAMATRYAKVETDKIVKERDKELKAAIVESEQAQKWSGIQESRGQSSFLTAPSNVTIERGRIISKVKGETVISPSK